MGCHIVSNGLKFFEMYQCIHLEIVTLAMLILLDRNHCQPVNSIQRESDKDCSYFRSVSLSSVDHDYRFVHYVVLSYFMMSH